MADGVTEMAADKRMFRLDLTLQEFAMLTTLSSIGTALVWSRFSKTKERHDAAEQMAEDTAHDFGAGPYDRKVWVALQDRMIAMTAAQPDAVLEVPVRRGPDDGGGV